MGTCRLCLEDWPLCRSHIIPEFLHSPVYDTDGRMLETSQGGTKTTFVQIGLREHLLCKRCEGFLNDTYEQYFRNLWYGPGVLPQTSRDDWFPLSGLDYTRFKLFHLSVFWRASVAKTHAFAQIELGPHEETVRRMLLDQRADPLTYQLFGTVMTMRPDGSVNHGFIMPPLPIRVDGVRLYSAVYGGCAWEIVFANHSLRGKYLDRMLKTDGSIRLGVDTLENYTPAANHFKTYAETALKHGWKLPWQRS